MALVTNTFSTGVISSADVNQNFTDVTSAIDNITTANINSAAGIVSTQLADRFALSPWHFNLLPVSSGANLASASLASYTCDNSAATTLNQVTARVKSGKTAAICVVEVYVAAVGVAGGAYPLLTVEKGTSSPVVLGGTGRTLNAAGFHYLYNNNPIDNPLIGIQDAEVLVFKIDGQSQAPTLRGLNVTLWIKEELTS